MKNWVLAFFSFLITLFLAIFQRATGPTYPVKSKFVYYDTLIKFKLWRSLEIPKTYNLTIPSDFDVFFYYKRYPSNDTFSIVKFQKKQDVQFLNLEGFPPSAKIVYFIEVKNKNIEYFSNKDNPLILRFKGAVPNYLLLLHVFFIFFAMFLSNYTLLKIVFNKNSIRLFTILTFVFFLIGGFILGPFVQKYAFGHYWTGFPYGKDLTDNKTLFVGLFWAMAVILNLKKERKFYIILASILTFLIFLIPHSLYGSQYNYETGRVEQGFVALMFLKEGFIRFYDKDALQIPHGHKNRMGQ